jgi:7-carboxy-7-deazaguanine synthase
MHYQLNEHFWTIQGEGEHAGYTAVFLRLQGCPVGCAWCDSKLTWYAGGQPVQVEDIPTIVHKYPASELIVVTGGEPLIYNLDPLFDILRKQFPERSIHVETSGVYPYKGSIRPDWTTVSPKYTVDFRVARNVLVAASELKYVVDEHFTLESVDRHLQDIASHRSDWPPVRLMPEGSPPRREMVERTMDILRERPLWRFGPRLQYNHASIAEGEGLNNKLVSADYARTLAHNRRVSTTRSPAVVSAEGQT